MKYILPIFIALFIVGCNNNTSKKINNKENLENNTSKNFEKRGERETQEIVIRLNDINLTFVNKTLIYPKKKIILLFDNNSTMCISQEAVLEKLNKKFIKTDNPFLANYFKIKKYPTIVVLDINKTVKYENFVPYEILKTEGF